jgi:hypothetical protein
MGPTLSAKLLLSSLQKMARVIGSDVRIVNISSEIFIYTMAPKGDLLDLIKGQHRKSVTGA